MAISQTTAVPLSDVVRPLIAKRDQRRSDNSLDPAIQLLDRDIQWHIRHQPEALLVPSAQVGRQEGRSLPQTS